MAQIEDPSGEKSTNVELNLVPFIDLMCVCITFLLITAVWTQVSMIQLGTSVYGKSSNEAQATPQKSIDVAFRLDVTKNAYILNLGLDVVRITNTSQGHDQITLLDELEKIRTLYPDKSDAVISMENSLSYNLMVQTMDKLIQAGFEDIGIAAGVAL